jgi:hypothetical protein
MQMITTQSQQMVRMLAEVRQNAHGIEDKVDAVIARTIFGTDVFPSSEQLEDILIQAMPDHAAVFSAARASVTRHDGSSFPPGAASRNSFPLGKNSQFLTQMLSLRGDQTKQALGGVVNATGSVSDGYGLVYLVERGKENFLKGESINLLLVPEAQWRGHSATPAGSVVECDNLRLINIDTLVGPQKESMERLALRAQGHCGDATLLKDNRLKMFVVDAEFESAVRVVAQLIE